jgi:hypothetical protein
VEISLNIPRNLTEESRDLIIEFAKEEETVNHHDPVHPSY